MGDTQTAATSQASQHHNAPGPAVIVRDEMWMTTNVARSVDGYRLEVRGLSEYVRDEDATFYTALDQIEVLDPTKVEVVTDRSPGYRQTRLWLETMLRQTPVPLYQEELSVSCIRSTIRSVQSARRSPRIILDLVSSSLTPWGWERRSRSA